MEELAIGYHDKSGQCCYQVSLGNECQKSARISADNDQEKHEKDNVDEED